MLIMSRGYFAIVQNNADVDYLSQAYWLALSIRATQSDVNNMSIMIDAETKKQITNKHKRVFDHIIDIPWQDESSESEWKINNKWKVYWATPYDETVLLDTDMVFPTDVSHWWPIMAQQDFWATTNTKTFRGETITSNYYRKAFVSNELPNIYTAFMYFKKSDIVTEIFELTKYIFHNWQRFYHLFLKSDRPNHISGDVAIALAINILGYEHLTTRNNCTEFPTFVHMKPECQDVPGLGTNWSKVIASSWSSPDNLIVGNIKQNYPFHYVDKDWVTRIDTSILEQA
jgi:hypothetical protein